MDSISSALHRGTFDTQDFDPVVAAWGDADELAEGASFGAPSSIPLNLHGISHMAPLAPALAAASTPVAPLAQVTTLPAHVTVPRSGSFFDRLAVGERDAVIVAVLATVALGGFGIWSWLHFGAKGVLGKALTAAALAG